MKAYEDEPFIEFTMWADGKYLAERKNKGLFFVSLLRDGEMVAHGQCATSFIPLDHFEPKYITPYYSHEKRKKRILKSSCPQIYKTTVNMK